MDDICAYMILWRKRKYVNILDGECLIVSMVDIERNTYDMIQKELNDYVMHILMNITSYGNLKFDTQCIMDNIKWYFNDN